LRVGGFSSGGLNAISLRTYLGHPQLRERAENWVSRYEFEIATLQQQQIEPPTR
jgi:hypothetical protein